MARSVGEWIGKDDNAPIPPKVKLRVKARAGDCCEICGARGGPGSDVDHIKAIINGGPNRESNLQYLCKTHHLLKTRVDVAEKSRVAKTQKHLAGFKTDKRNSWNLSRKMNGDVCRFNEETRKYDI